MRWIPADGSGAEDVLIPASAFHAPRAMPESWSPDGQTLAMTVPSAETGNDVMLYARREQRVTPFAATRFGEFGAKFSPDGRWLAYVSDESGQNDVYVRAVSGPSTKYPVSVGGGTAPLWSPSGRELFYRTASGLISVPVQTAGTFSAGLPTELLKGDFPADRHASPSPDGRRFAVLQALPAVGLTEISVVLNWTTNRK